jgi:hypothetical protein
VATALSALGRRTLPVYVMHMPVVAVLHGLSIGLLSARIGDQPLLAIVEPVSATGLVVAVCLLVHRALNKVGGLFDLPAFGRPGRPRAVGGGVYRKR